MAKAKATRPDYPSAAEDKKWQAEDALRTLTRAEEIRGDKSLMKDVERCRQEKMRELAAIKVETAPRTIKATK